MGISLPPLYSASPFGLPVTNLLPPSRASPPQVVISLPPFESQEVDSQGVLLETATQGFRRRCVILYAGVAAAYRGGEAELKEGVEGDMQGAEPARGRVSMRVGETCRAELALYTWANCGLLT